MTLTWHGGEKHNSNHMSISGFGLPGTIRDSQQPSSPIRFLILETSATYLVQYTASYSTLLYIRYMPTRLNDLLASFSTSSTCQVDLSEFWATPLLPACNDLWVSQNMTWWSLDPSVHWTHWSLVTETAHFLNLGVSSMKLPLINYTCT